MSETYSLSNKNIFQPSVDKTSLERRRAVREAANELKQMFPGLNIAFSLWGSLAKGRNLEGKNAFEHDIDLSVYYDKGELWEQFRNPDRENKLLTEIYNSEQFPNRNGPNYAEQNFQFYIKSWITKKLLGKTSANFNKNKVASFDVLGVDRDELQRFVDDPSYKSFTYLNLFAYDVTGNLKKDWIPLYLILLSKKTPEQRDEIWKMLQIKFLAFHRKNRQTGEIDVTDEILNKLPNSFEEACKFFGVKIN